jgi:magnesium chelatase accessory protein
MRWPADAQTWPLREHSQMVLHRPHRWHVQMAGTGDTLVLIHGAGGATQSWRGLFPLLAETHHVVAIDLPGQGFTQLGAQGRCGLDPMAEDLLALIRHLGLRPAALIGHSAGAAIALRLAELGAVPQGRNQGQMIGINAALGHFKGMAGWLFPVLAKALSLTPFTADIFARTTTEGSVRNMLRSTGSAIDDAGVALYLQLAQDRAHVDGTLSMMAQWQLDGLLARLPQITTPVTLITGHADGAVPPDVSDRAAALIPGARLISLPGLGHLAHEEDPDQIADLIRATLTRT